MQRITVLGPGRWGSFLAWYCAKQNFQTTLWGRPGSRSLKGLREAGGNEYMVLPSGIRLSDSLDEALSKAELVLVAVSAQEFRGLCKDLKPWADESREWLLCMKGLEAESGKRLTTVFREETFSDKVAVLAGPGHVQEFLKGHPNAMLVAAEDAARAEGLSALLGSKLIRLYHNADVCGVEIGAAAKNVIGIAAGMLDGLGVSSLKGALMARGAREVARLVNALGGNPMTVYGLSHLGDYEATLFSHFSQNRAYGEALAKGESFSKLAEGRASIPAMLQAAAQQGIELPITETLHQIVYKGLSPQEGLMGLFLRPQKGED